MKQKPIPVIDIFAGPGGLGEGFSSLGCEEGRRRFEICLSVEKDTSAHKTLELRNFFRQFTKERIPEDYYRFVRGEISYNELLKKYPQQAEVASRQTWLATLGKVSPEEVDIRIQEAVGGNEGWVLIGGPPCQAYSHIGRARSRGIKPDDSRLFLYKQYIHIINHHRPPVFVMENVEGILTARVDGKLIFNQILSGLKNPSNPLYGLSGDPHGDLKEVNYRIFPLVSSNSDFEEKDWTSDDYQRFVIKCEDYGVPQSRHRVILLGIRDDLGSLIPGTLIKSPRIMSASSVLNSLPRLRSGLSREYDSKENWYYRLRGVLRQTWFKELKALHLKDVYDEIRFIINNLRIPRRGRGGEFIYYTREQEYLRKWFFDPRLKGICNYTSRAHMVSDLHRYLYAACFSKVYNQSPRMADFPSGLLPDHRNVDKALTARHFNDRFRVQVSNRPSSTITSHISKDGHYYIHPDPSQCRSLTVREAARLQTFPDNYFFCGDRTQQYIQVGNAVPPFLARQIADIVLGLLKQAKLA